MHALRAHARVYIHMQYTVFGKKTEPPKRRKIAAQKFFQTFLQNYLADWYKVINFAPENDTSTGRKRR